MDTIIEYAQHIGATFSEVGPNEVDSLLFSQLCYLRFGEAFPDTAGGVGRALHDTFHLERFDTLYRGQRDEDGNYRLLAAVAASPRYRDVRVCHYVNKVDDESETQFSATAFVLPGDAGTYIAFRGTDATLVGWKENFNMSYRYPVRGQELACAYLDGIAGSVPHPLYVGGHSKGGNLAVYAAAKSHADIQDAIRAVFDHDGPGFEAAFYNLQSFARIRGRVHKTMPEDAVVGMLMGTLDGYRVVKCDAVGFLQHDPFNWGVDVEAADFHLAEGISRAAGWGDAIITEWMESFDEEQRGVFIDTLYRALVATGAETMRDLKHLGRTELHEAANVLIDADPETRRAVLAVVARLVRLAMTPQATWGKHGDGEVDGDAAPAGQSLLERLSAYAAELTGADTPRLPVGKGDAANER